MKKFISFLSIAVAVILVGQSCKPEVKKEVIVVPAQPTKTVTVKEPAPKNTTVTLDKTGVKVEAKKIDVTIKP